VGVAQRSPTAINLNPFGVNAGNRQNAIVEVMGQLLDDPDFFLPKPVGMIST
jgi:hypothetical protein